MIYFEDLKIVLSDNEGLIIIKDEVEYYSWYSYWGKALFTKGVPWEKHSVSCYLDLTYLMAWRHTGVYFHFGSFQGCNYWQLSSGPNHLISNLVPILLKNDTVIKILEEGKLVEDILE